jgi:hypothetical protein
MLAGLASAGDSSYAPRIGFMNNLSYGLVSAVALFLGMLAALEIGRAIGRRRFSRDEEKARAGLGAVEGAVFALLGLLIAFTFSGAAARFDTRRELIVQEANAIGTAWLRLDLLPPDTQPALRDLFRSYLDARLAAYEKVPDMKSVQAELSRANALQSEIWNGAISASQRAPNPLHASLIYALNEMFDITTTRTMAAKVHPPMLIFLMLGALALVSSLLAGYAMAGGRTRSWTHVIGFALIMAITVYVILDLEYPRVGFLRVDDFDQALKDLRQSMK